MSKDKLQFYKKGHLYTLGGKPLTGVTTILNVISKPFLIPWAVKMATEYIRDNFDATKHVVLEELDILLSEAKKAHTQNRDKAGDIGTEAHRLIEQWIKSPDGNVEISKDHKINKMVKNFCDWAVKNKVKFLGSEEQVYSEKYWYAGTADFVCEMNGKIWLGDIKTGGTRIYPEAFFQCSGYQICKEEMNPDIKIDGLVVVGIFKDGSFEEKRSINNKQNKKAFLSALTLYRALEDIKSNTLDKGRSNNKKSITI